MITVLEVDATNRIMVRLDGRRTIHLVRQSYRADRWHTRYRIRAQQRYWGNPLLFERVVRLHFPECGTADARVDTLACAPFGESVL